MIPVSTFLRAIRLACFARLRRQSECATITLAIQELEERTVPSATSTAVEVFDASPALFVENQGQWENESVRYAFFGSGANVLHTDSGPVFQLFQQFADDDTEASSKLPVQDDVPHGLGDVSVQQACFSASFDGANMIEPVGLDQAATLHNYYVGEQSRWRTAVPSYQTVAYPGVYEGIDLLTWGRRNSLKYEFHIEPGADYQQIQVSYQGIEGLSLDDAGALHIQTQLGELIDDAPYIYQQINGEHVEIAGEFRLVDQDTYAFQLTGNYDADTELIIDPLLVWSTYLGGTTGEYGYGVAVDSSGNPMVTGITGSSDWTSGGFDTSYDGGFDAFVAKLSSAGAHLWSTYLGGTDRDYGSGIAVDGSGNPMVTGETCSSGWTSGGFDTSHNGGVDAFVAKLSSAGAHLWSTYLGGPGDDYGTDIAVDAAGNPMVTGYTFSSDWASGGFDTSHNGDADAFVAKLSSAGAHLWSTLSGGTGIDCGYGIAVDAAGNPMVTGYTYSSGWTSGGSDTSHNGDTDAFVAKLSSAGAHLWSTYLEEENGDSGYGIATDGSGNSIVTGNTSSTSWASGGFDTSHNGGIDAFVAKLSSAGAHLWSTYLGGTGFDYGKASPWMVPATRLSLVKLTRRAGLPEALTRATTAKVMPSWPN